MLIEIDGIRCLCDNRHFGFCPENFPGGIIAINYRHLDIHKNKVDLFLAAA